MLALWNKDLTEIPLYLGASPNSPWNNTHTHIYNIYIYIYDHWLVVWKCLEHFCHILGISSSQLTNSYFSEGFEPPSSDHLCIYTYHISHLCRTLGPLRLGRGGNHSARRFKNLRAGLWVRLGSIFCGSWNHKNQDTLWRFLAPLNPSSDSVDCGYLWFANSNFHDQCPNCYRKNLESNILQDSRWRNLHKIVS